MAMVLLAKILEGQPASFVRSEGELFVIAVNGQERTVSRDLWRSLPEQVAQERDRSHHSVSAAGTVTLTG